MWQIQEDSKVFVNPQKYTKKRDPMPEETKQRKSKDFLVHNLMRFLPLKTNEQLKLPS